MKSIRMRNGFCYDEVYYTSLKRGRRIMVITQASQACDAGSIPVARSNKNVRQWLIAIAVFLLSG